MKKFLLSLLLVAFLCSSAWAAGPTIEEDNYMQFTAADQETTTKFTIYTIVWTSCVADDIADNDTMVLEDGNGTVILDLAATAAGDKFIIHIPNGIRVHGLKAEILDGGYLYVYGKRR